jgi:hypothetical protein
MGRAAKIAHRDGATRLSMRTISVHRRPPDRRYRIVFIYFCAPQGMGMHSAESHRASSHIPHQKTNRFPGDLK